MLSRMRCDHAHPSIRRTAQSRRWRRPALEGQGRQSLARSHIPAPHAAPAPLDVGRCQLGWPSHVQAAVRRLEAAVGSVHQLTPTIAGRVAINTHARPYRTTSILVAIPKDRDRAANMATAPIQTRPPKNANNSRIARPECISDKPISCGPRFRGKTVCSQTKSTEFVTFSQPSGRETPACLIGLEALASPFRSYRHHPVRAFSSPVGEDRRAKSIPV
jgi:hypothetical protein